jgi:hypothetical protein
MTVLSNLWIQKRTPYWERLTTLVAAAGQSRGLSRGELQELALLYRQTFPLCARTALRRRWPVRSIICSLVLTILSIPAADRRGAISCCIYAMAIRWFSGGRSITFSRRW